MYWPYVGVASLINEANTSNGVVEQPNSELDRRTTTGLFKKNCTHQCVSLLTQMHLPYVGVAYVINEMNTSNGVVEHLTSKLNERTTCDFVHGCITMKLSKQFQWKVQTLYTENMVLLIIRIIARSYA